MVTATATVTVTPEVSPKIASADRDKLLTALDSIERRGRRADFDRAAWARKVVALSGVHARRVMVEQLGLSASTAVAYLRRLEDMDRVPDATVWVAVGWARVRQIARIECEAARAAVMAAILETRNDRGIASDCRAREILKDYLPKPKEGEVVLGSLRGDGPLIGRALSELRHILEHYDLDGYEPPAEIVAFVGAVMTD
jgi:siroheme synthase (precorrin-2 oxidase/ferrochelatase)